MKGKGAGMLDTTKYTKIKITNVIEPYSAFDCTLEVFTNRYWVVSPDDCILFYDRFFLRNAM